MDPVLTQIRGVLDAGGGAPLRVTGTSMVPFLRDRKDIVTLHVFEGLPRTGDILFYLPAPDQPLLHRFHKVLPDGRYLLCGDHQKMPEHVPPEQVWARVTVIHRNGRHISADAPWWRLLSLLWIWLYPIRNPLLAAIHWAWKHFKR